MADEKTPVTNNGTVKAGGVVRVLNNTAEKTKELLRENSIVGEKIESDGVTVIPVSKLSIGFAGGGSDAVQDKKKSQPAGAGAKVSLAPVSFLVIKDGEVKLISATEPEKEGIASVAAGLVSKAGDIFKSVKGRKKDKKK